MEKIINFLQFAWKAIITKSYSTIGFIMFLLGISLLPLFNFSLKNYLIYSLYFGGAMLMLMRVYFVMGKTLDD